MFYIEIVGLRGSSVILMDTRDIFKEGLDTLRLNSMSHIIHQFRNRFIIRKC